MSVDRSAIRDGLLAVADDWHKVWAETGTAPYSIALEALAIIDAQEHGLDFRFGFGVIGWMGAYVGSNATRGELVDALGAIFPDGELPEPADLPPPPAERPKGWRGDVPDAPPDAPSGRGEEL